MGNELDSPLAVRMYLKERRKARKLTQEQLASAANVSTTAIHNLEAGKNGFTDKMLATLADALGCQPADILLPLNGSGAKVRTEAEIRSMLATIEGLSPTDIEVALAVIMNSLKAKHGESGLSVGRGLPQTSTPRRAEEPSH